MSHKVFGMVVGLVYHPQFTTLTQIWSLLASKIQDGNGHNAKVKALKQYSTNQLVTLQWLCPLLIKLSLLTTHKSSKIVSSAFDRSCYELTCTQNTHAWSHPMEND